jgi:trk system potassium uptake protein TrkA
MKQIAIIGLSSFGRRVLEELLELNCEVLIVDKDRDVVATYKDRVAAAFVADALNEELIRKLIPATVDVAVVDVGGRTEVSILLTNYLKKMGVRTIVAKADSNEHGEILELVGATRVVFPNREAAKRLVPLLSSADLYSFLPLSGELAIAEIRVPEQLVGKTAIEADVRKRYNLNVIGFRKAPSEEYTYFQPAYRMGREDAVLVAGREADIVAFGAGRGVAGKRRQGLLRRLSVRLRGGRAER